MSPRSIRHYEKKGLISSVRQENNYREFDETAVERIKTIQYYLGLGMTAEQTENVMNCNDIGPDQYEYCDDLLRTFREKSEQIADQIRLLESSKRRLDDYIALVVDHTR